MSTDPVLRIIDAEAGGDISRVIIDGAPALRGATIAARRDDFAARYDHLRWKLIRPPHGELHMCPVLLLDTRDQGADFGVIIMESMGYPSISGSNLFCAAAVALETGIVAMQEPESRLRVATPAGIIDVRARCRDGKCLWVEFDNTSARIKSVIHDPFPITVVAAGVDYAAVDADLLETSLAPAYYDILVANGRRIADVAGTDFVLFHGRMTTDGDTNSCPVAVFQNPSVICRSPTGTGTSAMLVLAHAAGAIRPDTTLTTRSPAGNIFQGRITGVRRSASGIVVDTAVSGEVHTGASFSIA